MERSKRLWPAAPVSQVEKGPSPASDGSIQRWPTEDHQSVFYDPEQMLPRDGDLLRPEKLLLLLGIVSLPDSVFLLRLGWLRVVLTWIVCMLLSGKPLKCMNIKWKIFLFVFFNGCSIIRGSDWDPPPTPFPLSSIHSPLPPSSVYLKERLHRDSTEITFISRSSFLSHWSHFNTHCCCFVAESAGSQSGPSVCSVLCTSSGRRFGLLFAWPG